MPTHNVTFSPLLDANTLVLTANERLQRYLTSKTVALVDGEVRPSPQIVSLQAWLLHCWQDLQDQCVDGCDKRLLSDTEELVLWRQLINAHGDSDEWEKHEIDLGEYINLTHLIDSAAKAVNLLAHWKLNSSSLDGYDSKESTLLRICLAKYYQTLENNHWITKSQAIALLGPAIASGIVPKPGKLCLYGFAELSPLWLSVVEQLDTTPLWLPAASKTIDGNKRQGLPRKLKQYSSEIEEIDAAAFWSKQILDNTQKAGGDFSSLNIGIIVPNLSANHALVVDRFTRVFDPHYLGHPERGVAEVPFDISVSQNLIEEPVVAAVLNFFKFDKSSAPREELLKLNSCAFWGKGTNEHRLRTSRWLKQQLNFNCSLSHYVDFLYKCSEQTDKSSLTNPPQPSEPPTLANADIRAAGENIPPDNDGHFLTQFRQQLRQLRKRQTLSQWQQSILQLLNTIGWPGPRVLTSREFQAVQIFKELLNSLSQYSSVVSYGSTAGQTADLFEPNHQQRTSTPDTPLALNDALTVMRLLTEKTPFHVQTPKRPIQILGIMEGSGMPFSHCWMMAMTSINFPTPPQPNPLLPLQLQKQQAMPRATPERELDYANSLLQSYLATTSDITVSYSAFSDDQANEPSPLISNPVKEDDTTTSVTPPSGTLEPLLSPINAIDSHIKMQLGGQQLTAVDATYGPPIPPGTAIKGGAAHLELHTANPFYAFVRYQLNVLSDQQPIYGLPAFVKGNIIHDVLAAIWKKLCSSEQLHAMAEHDVSTLIENEVLHIANKHFSRLNIQLSSDAKTLYLGQFCQLIQASISVDKSRPPFYVASIESTHQFPLQLNSYQLRIDRIDYTKDGLVIIDYKTGDHKIGSLLGSPLLSPQLPLYALAGVENAGFHLSSDNQTIAAVGFFNLHLKSCAMTGIGELTSRIDGIYLPQELTRYKTPTSWPDILQWWQDNIVSMHNEMCSGYAAGTVRNPAIARFYSHLDAAARINTENSVGDETAND